MSTNVPSGQSETFVETALKLGGKSEEEARTTGAIDRADEQVEALFAERYRTTASPVHRAVWDREFPVELFNPQPAAVSDRCRQVMQASLEIVQRRKASGALLDENGKVSEATLRELAEAGYWGLLVDEAYGGVGAPFAVFSRFLTRMATVDATVAGLASVHGCIGAVDPLRTFGNEEQKQRYLPLLASGERLSGFALTEPAAGSDLTALRTTAELDGDAYVVRGEKLFITNAIPGRTVGLVCLIEGKPAVLIVDLPNEENDQFQLVRYGLHALKHSYNNGLKFHGLRVPRENLLDPGQGDGLTIAYHGLNRGRVALCATAAGMMRVMLADMLPWAHFRKTYGAAIETRELVRRRIGLLAGLIVAADAAVDWCGWLLDEGYRGEMECIVAKIFGSEAQKEAAIEYYMKTHGGRAFLHGHLFGDEVHEFLAPCIYEGEGEMLGLGFFKSLIKEHGRRYYQPIGMALQQAGLTAPNPLNPLHAWKLRKALMPYAQWWMGQRLGGWKPVSFASLPKALREYAEFFGDFLQRSRLEIDNLMRRHQLKLADRQCAMAELSSRLQQAVLGVVTALYAARQDDELVRTAAEVFCREAQRRLTGERPHNRDFRRVTELGAAVAAGRFQPIAEVQAGEILMPYDDQTAATETRAP